MLVLVLHDAHSNFPSFFWTLPLRLSLQFSLTSALAGIWHSYTMEHDNSNPELLSRREDSPCQHNQ